MANIEFKNVTKKYGKSIAIKHLNLEVEDGEFMVLVGPSGCGKSTLLRMIAGLEEIDEGEVFIGAQLVNHLPPKDRDIAIVFQNYALYPHMTVYENLAFGLKIRGVEKAIIKEKVNRVAKTLEIEDLLMRKPKDMSGGQRQRVAIGRAIVRDPKVFLFDEPLSNLDAKLRTQMRLEIAALHKKLKTTIVYVTHDQVEAMTLGDRIAVMHNGEISQLGSPQELYNNPANLFVAGFIGSPAMNFIKGKIKIENDASYFIAHNEFLIIPLSSTHNINSEATIGIRPEHITLHSSEVKDKNTHEGKIVHIERMGFESFIFIESGDLKWTVRSVDTSEYKEGMMVWYEILKEKVHVFV
jgi:multiple sugar transport system ATP-binding protein